MACYASQKLRHQLCYCVRFRKDRTKQVTHRPEQAACLGTAISHSHMAVLLQLAAISLIILYVSPRHALFIYLFIIINNIAINAFKHYK